MPLGGYQGVLCRRGSARSSWNGWVWPPGLPAPAQRPCLANPPSANLPGPCSLSTPACRKASEGSEYCFQHGGEKSGKSKGGSKKK